MLLFIFLTGMLIFLIFIAVYLYISGLFYTPKIEIGPAPFDKILICYKFYQRPYEEARHAFKEMLSFKLNKNVKFIGIYYDDPDKVSRDKLRHIVGAVLGNPDVDGSVDRQSQSILERNGYKTIVLPKISTAILSQFPTKTVLSMLLAVNYVYPKANEFVKKNKLSPTVFIEYYPGKITHFVAPLADSNPFIVDEFKETNESDPYYSEINKKSE